MNRCILDILNPLPMCQLSLYLWSGENVIVPSLYIDIDSYIDINSQSALDILIARRKRKRSCTLHPQHNFLSYARLSTQYHAFISSIDSHLIPKYVSDAMSNLGWRAAMEDEIHASEQNRTWELVSLIVGKKVVGCRWVYTVKLNRDGTLVHLFSSS